MTYGQVQDSLFNLDKKDNRNQEICLNRDNYLIVYSGQYDMIGSAQNLFSASKLFGRGLDKLTCKSDNASGFNYCFKNIPGRVLCSGINWLFNTWFAAIQHEYMGHGFRGREFNAKINSYNILPRFLGGGVINVHGDISYYGQLLVDAGGTESTTIFAREAFRQSLLNDYFFHYDLYTFLQKGELTIYIFTTPKVGSPAWNDALNSEDPARYITNFVKKSKDDEKTILKSLQKGAIWSFADPSIWMSWVNWGMDYLGQGKEQVRNQMFNIKSIHFLPYTDFNLSPFGYEYYAGVYLKYNKTLYETYYRWSSGNVDGKSYGLGINFINLLRYSHLRFDIGFDFWKQGFNLLYYEKDNNKYQKDVITGKIYVKTFYTISNFFSLMGQASYKGEGYLMGNPIEKGFNGKIGIALNF